MRLFFKPQNGKCHFNPANVGANDTGFVDIKSKSESDLQNAVATVGPISVAIDASHTSFQLYKYNTALIRTFFTFSIFVNTVNVHAS